MIERALAYCDWAVARGLMPDEYLVGPQDLVRVLPSPDVINIVVCGDPDLHAALADGGTHRVGLALIGAYLGSRNIAVMASYLPARRASRD